MRIPRFTTLQLLLAAALVALVLGLFTSSWRVSAYHRIEHLAFSPSGTYLAAKYSGGAVQVWKLDGNRARVVAQSRSGASLLSFDFGTIHFVGDDRLLKVETHFELGQLIVRELIVSTRQEREVTRLLLTQVPSMFQTVNEDHLFQLDPGNPGGIVSYSFRTQKPERRWKIGQAVTQLRLSADGRTLAATDENGLIHVIDTAADAPLAQISGGGPRSMAISGDGRTLAVAPAIVPAPAAVSIYAAHDPGLPDDVTTQIGFVEWSALSADGSRLAVMGNDVAECYDVKTKQRLTRIVLEDRRNSAASFIPGFMEFGFPAAAFSPDGSRLATIAGGGQVQLWDVPSGKLAHVLTGGSRWLQIAIFTFGFAGWAAAWGIVSKRERARLPRPAIPQPAGQARPVPKVVSPIWALTKALFWLGLALLFLLFLIGGAQPVSLRLVLGSLGQVFGALVLVVALGLSYIWIVRLVRGRHYFTLLRLRQVTATPGRLLPHGRAQFWFASASPIESQIGQAFDEIATRAEDLFGEGSGPRQEPQTLVGWLDRQCDLDAFVGRHMPIAAIVPDVWRGTNAVVCEETAHRNFGRPLSALRSALALMFSIRHKRGLLPGWVAGLALRELCRNEETPADVRAATRRLKLLFARRPDWNPRAIFERTAAERRALWLAMDEADAAREVRAETDLLVTLTPLLIGDAAPPARRQRMIAWLRAIRPKDNPVPSLETALGCSLDQLLAEWRTAIETSAGVPYDTGQRERQRELQWLTGAMILDRAQPPGERARALRSLSGTSYAGSAGPLIELLAQPQCELRLEIIQCLENLAGQPLGDDVPAWRAWWESLPPEVRWQQSEPALLADVVQRATGGEVRPQPVREALGPAPLELKFVWGLMTIGGLAALAIPITFLFLVGPVLGLVTVYFGLIVGVLAIARGAARDTHGLATAARLQAINVIACDPINLLFSGLEHFLLRRPHVQYYLSQAGEGAASQL